MKQELPIVDWSKDKVIIQISNVYDEVSTEEHDRIVRDRIKNGQFVVGDRILCS